MFDDGFLISMQFYPIFILNLCSCYRLQVAFLATRGLISNLLKLDSWSAHNVLVWTISVAAMYQKWHFFFQTWCFWPHGGQNWNFWNKPYHIWHGGCDAVIVLHNTWGPSSLWAELKTQIAVYWAHGGQNWNFSKNFMCIIVSFRCYNIHGVHIVCELS